MKSDEKIVPDYLCSSSERIAKKFNKGRIKPEYRKKETNCLNRINFLIGFAVVYNSSPASSFDRKLLVEI